MYRKDWCRQDKDQITNYSKDSHPNGSPSIETVRLPFLLTHLTSSTFLTHFSHSAGGKVSSCHCSHVCSRQLWLLNGPDSAAVGWGVCVPGPVGTQGGEQTPSGKPQSSRIPAGPATQLLKLDLVSTLGVKICPAQDILHLRLTTKDIFILRGNSFVSFSLSFRYHSKWEDWGY